MTHPHPDVWILHYITRSGDENMRVVYSEASALRMFSDYKDSAQRMTLWFDTHTHIPKIIARFER